MASIETSAQTFRTLIRTRTFCLGMMIVLLWWAEDPDAAPAVGVGWGILLTASLLSLLFAVLGKIKRATPFLMPLLLLVDGFLVGLWVSVSGGPVSYYMPFFLLILVATILVLAPRTAIAVMLGELAIFIGMLYLDYLWRVPSSFGAGRINFMANLMEASNPEVRRAIYLHQGLRWLFFFALMIATCVLLMRQVWMREERLRIREKALEQKRHLIQMGELTGRIAHGVNTPLGLISGNLELLMAETRKAGKTHRKLLQIDQYVQRAIRTVRDILDFGRQSLSEIKPTAVPKIVQAVASAVQPKLKKAGGKLILDVGPRLPEIMAYPEGLFQALLNLVENAIDSIRPGGLITLSAHFQYRTMRLSPGDRRGEIKVVVRDTGRGIPAGELERIFEPFYSTKGFGKGTGLGLAIVKRIVEEHRGQVKVESRVGEGTVFILLFPTDGWTGEGTDNSHEIYYNEAASKEKERYHG